MTFIIKLHQLYERYRIYSSNPDRSDLYTVSKGKYGRISKQEGIVIQNIYIYHIAF